jgi:hypothetical protein
MEATIKWTYPENSVQKALANFLKPVDIMVRSSKAEHEGGEDLLAERRQNLGI